jgi:hypothetical protein
MMETLTFRDFLLDYMNRHEMKSARELAAFLDMDPSMVSQAISSADRQRNWLAGLDIIACAAVRAGSRAHPAGYQGPPPRQVTPPDAAMPAHR